MHFTTAFSTLAAVVVLAAIQAKAQSPAVEFCTSDNLTGTCEDIFPANGQCVTFAADSGFNDAVSSVHVQSGTTCTVFM